MANLFSIDDKIKNVLECKIEEILPYSIISSINAIIDKNDKIASITSMLLRFHSHLINKIVVIENYKPIGTISDLDILRGLNKNPRFEFFNNSTVEDIIDKDTIIVRSNTKISSLLKELQDKNSEFAIIENDKTGFSVISINKLLQIGLLLDSSIKISNISPKKYPSFKTTDSINEIILRMLDNNTSIAILENSSLFITSQMILEKIQNELKYLQGIDDFMNLKMNDFKLKQFTVVSNNKTISDMCKIMLNIKQPYVMTETHILTPQDVIMGLCY